MGFDFTALLDQNNLLVVGAIVAVLSTAKAMFSEAFKKQITQRILPIFPILLGNIAAFAGATNAETAVHKVILGTLIGFVAGHIFKIYKTSVRGQGLDETSTEEENK